MEPEHYATQLIEDAGISTLPVDPYSIADEMDIVVEDMDLENVSGILFKAGDRKKIGIKKDMNPMRKRFTLAHELGHNEIPTHKNAKYECSEDYLNPFLKYNSSIEQEANRFAAELLMPTRLFKPLVYQFKPEFSDLDELSDICDASLTATAIKFLSLTEECCALVVSDGKYIKWSAKSNSFKYYIQSREPVSSNTLTNSYKFKGLNSEASSQLSLASYWIEGKGIYRDTELSESCLPLPSYNQILTLLWIMDPIIDDEDDDYEERYEDKDGKWR